MNADTTRQMIIERVFANDPHVDIEFSIDEIPPPSHLGFRRATGEPRGQVADYRFTVGDHSVHARVYPRVYSIHWDLVDPIVNAIEHLRRDSPGYYTLVTTSAGAAIGAGFGSLSRDKSNAALGAVIGGLLGFAIGVATAEW